MKRVMFVTNSLTGGGAERSMNLVTNELTYRGWPIALVPINAGPVDQITPVSDIFPLERQWRGSFASTIKALWNFNQVVNLWKPDVIVLNCDLPELFGVCIFSSQKLVAVEHINFPWITRKRFGRFVRKALEIRKITWVAVSSHLTIWPNHETPLRVLLNAIASETNSVTSNPDRTASIFRLKRLVFIGRLAEQKRPDWVLEISSQTQLPVEIIGDGLMINELAETATANNLEIAFRGQVVNPWSLVREGDLLIVPSQYEGDGLVVIEALHYGIPILLADTPDFRRFGFPESNYCLEISDFVRQINYSRNNVNNLLIPEELSKSLLSSRSLKMVGDSWEEFLDHI
ncbi:MAG: glycosyltransferase [Streptomycetaceae bacterium]|nr:MAG: glycosyltransferase [Streptomycetaceae bacterium]